MEMLSHSFNKLFAGVRLYINTVKVQEKYIVFNMQLCQQFQLKLS